MGDIFAVHGSYLQDWLFLPTDWNWRLVPEMSGESRAMADIGSHWCDLLQFITGQTITKVLADLQTIHKTRMKPKKEVETYAGKELSPEDYEPQEINTEDYASVLFELSSGAHGVVTVSQVSAGRKNRLSFEIDGSKCALAWDQERPNEMWLGYREKANEVLMKDPSLLHEDAREYAHYPGGHPEAYPDGPKNLFRNVYRAVEEGSHAGRAGLEHVRRRAQRSRDLRCRCSPATSQELGSTLRTRGHFKTHWSRQHSSRHTPCAVTRKLEPFQQADGTAERACYVLKPVLII